MTSKTNTFEGQPSGTTWVYTDSGGGSGDAFASPNTAGSGTVTVVYDNTQAFNGSQSLHLTCAATSQYILRMTGLNGSSLSARFYLRIVSSSAAQDIVQFRNGSGQAAAIGLSSSRQLQIKNALGGVLQTFAALALNTWYRIEMQVTKGVATASPFDGVITAAYYLGDSAAPVETAYTSNTVNAGTGNLTEWRLGKLTSAPSFEAFFDSVGVNDASANPLGTYLRTGNGAGLLTVTGNGVGSKRATGTGGTVLSLTGNGVGSKRGAGSGVGALTVTGNGGGWRISRGVGVGQLTISGTGAARKRSIATGISGPSVSGSGGGSKRATGLGLGVVTITGDGQGHGPDVRRGSGVAVPTVTTTGAGRKRATAAAAGTLTVTGTGVGRKSTQGAGVAPLTVNAAGAAAKRAAGSGAAAVSVAAVGAAQKRTTAQGYGLLVVIGAGAGTALINKPFTVTVGPGQTRGVTVGQAVTRSATVGAGQSRYTVTVGPGREA